MLSKKDFSGPVQLGIILIFIIFISYLIGNQFIFKDIRTAKDYKILSNFSPELIIAYQEKHPSDWKDYVAIISAQPHLAEKDKNSILNIYIQLDNKIPFENLVWPIDNRKYIKTAKSYKSLLDNYSVYTPGEYLFPLEQQCYYIDTFGADREGGKRSHQGTDLFDDKGTPILNVCDGTVEKLGWNRLGGERVGVRGDDGNYYYYAHLDKINIDLAIGQRIAKGDYIGTMGNTGDAITTPDHLHFGIELPNGDWLNPYPLLKVWEYHKFGIENGNN